MENFSVFRKEELKYQGKFLLDQTFTEGLTDRWQVSEFKVQGDYDTTCEVGLNWEPLRQMAPTKGFELTGRVLKPRINIRLKSLACDFKLKVRMAGDSCLFLISRNQGFIEENSPVVKITNDNSLNGLFAMFGNVNVKNNRLVFMKQVQIPEDKKLQPEGKNYKDLEINFNDNGDSRVLLSVSSFGKYNPIAQFFTFCDTFAPYFEKSRILIGASGRSVLLKKVTVQQRERNQNKLQERSKEACCCVI
jgi:hypothetical protein